MKRLLSLAAFLALQLSISAQILRSKTEVAPTTSTAKPKATKVPEKPKPIVIPAPEFINQPCYYDSSENKLIKLENTAAQLVSKKKTLGLKGSKQSILMQAPTSKVRFITKTSIGFIIKTSGDVNDLTAYLKLYKFSSADEKREVNISVKEGMLNDKDEQKGKSVNFSVKMIAPDNYMIEFPQPLEAGEYGFVWVKNMDLKEYNVFAFGVDWRNSD